MEKTVSLSARIQSTTLIQLVVTAGLIVVIQGHGRLWEPPSRSSMWRRGYNTTVNINDNELSCGGFTNQWISYRGLCGVCGDPYQQDPRDNEIGGKYYSGIVTRTYPIGGKVDVIVGLTANHGGYFEFKLCPIIDLAEGESHACFESYPLEILNNGEDKYKYVVKDQKLEGEVKLTVVLPQKLECNHCVLRWKYRTGTRWGCDTDLSCGKGKGPQEEFYNCADISIADVPNTIYNDPVIPTDQDKGPAGLNDLGSRNSRVVKVSVDPLRQMSQPTTQFGHSYFTAQPRTVHISTAGTRSPSESHVSSTVIWHPTKVMYDSNFPTRLSTVSQAPRQTIARQIKTVMEPDSTIWQPQRSMWQFLEDITTEAMLHYYQKNFNDSAVRCKARSRFRNNPIVFEFCQKQCSGPKYLCPQKMCDCASEQVPVQSYISSERDHSSFSTLIRDKHYEKRNLKNFVRKLIFQNRLVQQSSLEKSPWHLEESQESPTRTFLPNIGTLVTVMTPPSGRYTSPDQSSLQSREHQMGHHESNPASHPHGDFDFKPDASRVVASEIQLKQGGYQKKHPVMQPRVLTCKPSNEFSHNPYMERWCNNNCPFGFCPSRVCLCNM